LRFFKQIRNEERSDNEHWSTRGCTELFVFSEGLFRTMTRVRALLVLVTSVAIGLWYYGYIDGIIGQSSPTVPAIVPKQLPHQIPIQQLEQRVASSKPIYKRVAVGYNTNSDLIVPGLQLLRALNISANSIKPADYEKLTTMDEFVASFSHFFALGSAAERFIEDENLCRQIIDTAQHLQGAQKEKKFCNANFFFP
jgi:hypothetical protein